MLPFAFLPTVFSALVFTSLAVADDHCPRADLGETAEDCPWAEIARTLESTRKAGGDLYAKLKEVSPQYADHLKQEGKLHESSQGYKALWGKSLNYDEHAKATIVSEPIIDLILSQAGVAARDGKVVHAGFTHTYGYLLSTLRTPFGYKRARWVRDDLEKGFGLPRGTLGPLPREGGLFSNVTYFAGKIAFRTGKGKQSKNGERLALSIVERGAGVAPELKKLPFSFLKYTRLEETLHLPRSRVVILRTDLVPFTGTSGENAEVLIYSVYDSETALPQLITVFPVAKNFRDSLLKAADLGPNQPITTRYNAFISGVTDSQSSLTGKREITQIP